MNDAEAATKSTAGRPRTGAFDPWELEDSQSYSRSKRYTRATNKHDHSANVQVPLPREILGAINDVLATKAIPEYRSIQDFIRDSIYHNLHYYSDEMRLERLQKTLNSEMLLSQIEEQGRQIENYRRISADTRSLILQYRIAEDYEGLSKFIEMQTEIANEIPQPYKGQLLTILSESD